jgi:hypothetical protein
MNNTLYINPLTPEINFLIFVWEETITRTLAKNLDTASTFPKLLVALVDEYNITDIWCVTGPGPFTLMRVVTLATNAIAYTRDVTVRSCHFFDLITSGNQPIIEANPREYLIRQGGEVVSVAKWDLPEGVYEGIFPGIDSTVGEKSIQYMDNQEHITQVFANKNPETRISPIYFKPPHITCPKP